jgi:uncharacterized protein
MFTAFLKHKIVASGSETEVAEALRALPPLERASDLLVFDDETGRQIDLDLRLPEPARRGRPALGVVAREVTLLPRHWDWLTAQRGGASAAIRRLVDSARTSGPSEREAHDRAYRFLSAIAGDLPKFEDAVREIYIGNRVGYDHFTFGWPEAIRDHGRALAFPA